MSQGGANRLATNKRDSGSSPPGLAPPRVVRRPRALGAKLVRRRKGERGPPPTPRNGPFQASRGRRSSGSRKTAVGLIAWAAGFQIHPPRRERKGARQPNGMPHSPDRSQGGRGSCTRRLTVRYEVRSHKSERPTTEERWEACSRCVRCYTALWNLPGSGVVGLVSWPSGPRCVCRARGVAGEARSSWIDLQDAAGVTRTIGLPPSL